MKKTWLATLALGTLIFAPLSQTNAAESKKICIFDIAGNSGPVMSLMQDWKAEALKWGIDAQLVPYTNEGIAAVDLQGGACDAAMITGIRARKYNRYTGTTDSIGSIQDLDSFQKVLMVLAHPSQADKMHQNGYRILGIAPAGAAYIFVNDRQISSLAKAAGKKVAVLSYDKTQAEMVAMVGATPVDSDITNFSTKFNNGIVDIIAAPMAAYEALELYKGMDKEQLGKSPNPKGGVINYPLMQITLQLIGGEKAFSAEVAQKSRTYFASQLDKALRLVRDAEQGLDDKWWVEIPEEDKPEYEHLMQQARIQIRDSGQYDGEMLTLLRKVRCSSDASRAECTDPVE